MQHKTISNTVELFILDCQAQRFTHKTVTFYRDQLRKLLRWCDAANLTYLDDLTHNQIRAYLAHEHDRGMSSHYVHATARAVRTFCRFAMRDGLLDANPFDRVKMPRLEDRVLPALTNDEVRRLLQACKRERDRAIVLFLLDSGVRAQELCNLNLADIDMDTGAVTVRQGKGQKDRTVQVGAKTRLQLRRYLLERGHTSPTTPLFTAVWTDDRLTYSGLSQALTRLRKAANIPHATPHAFRRTFAITCLRNGMNIYILARLMGHADIQVLRKYLPLVEQDLEDAHERHGPVDNMT